MPARLDRIVRMPSLTNNPSPDDAPWLTARLADLWRWPLPHHRNSPVNRFLNRAVIALIRSRIESVSGLEHILERHGAFIVAANHESRRDAVILPAVLLMARGGLPVHFLADWNFKLIPGVAALYARSGAITVSGKPARPAILEPLRPLLGGDRSPYDAARAALEDGRPVGIFPEGTTNRDTSRLLRGRYGCARLSLECRAPVVPVGITYPGHERSPRKPPDARARLVIASPMSPPACPRGERAGTPIVRRWHADIMHAIADLCRKPWHKQKFSLDPVHPEVSHHDSRHHQGFPGQERPDPPQGPRGAASHLSRGEAMGS